MSRFPVVLLASAARGPELLRVLPFALLSSPCSFSTWGSEVLIQSEDRVPFLKRPSSLHLLPGAPAASLILTGEKEGEEVESFV